MFLKEIQMVLFPSYTEGLMCIFINIILKYVLLSEICLYILINVVLQSLNTVGDTLVEKLSFKYYLTSDCYIVI